MFDPFDSFFVITLRVAELRHANLTEYFLFISQSFLYLPRPVIKAHDPSCVAPKCSRRNMLVSLLELFKHIQFFVYKVACPSSGDFGEIFGGYVEEMWRTFGGILKEMCRKFGGR